MSRLRYLLAATVAAATPAVAQEKLPVARITIYPGDVIAESMLDERAYGLAPGSEPLYARARETLIGKMARRTLLPGQPIPTIAIDNPRIINVGAQIKIVFAEDGLQIVAYGIAQQAGAIGDLIRVRNQDSGLFISGRIQNDGSVRVGEG
ncbi:flagellar basal body P-ring formation chaperone FlgA [Methylocystis parvus]|uniref:flagellar basal body P-ring formation chaperone FlgA n=1 Tax=Methylocystis parvus TaxID=134 RepID=UPI003C760DE6